MIKIVNGSLLDAKENIICHQVNCQGVMGAGVALAIKKKWPEVYTRYSQFCNQVKRGESIVNEKILRTEDMLGLILPIKVDDTKDIAVFNFFSQLNYGRGSNQTSLEDFEKCVNKTHALACTENKTVAMPYKIGCGLAGGDWKDVYEILYRYFGNGPVDLTLYKI